MKFSLSALSPAVASANTTDGDLNAKDCSAKVSARGLKPCDGFGKSSHHSVSDTLGEFEGVRHCDQTLMQRAREFGVTLARDDGVELAKGAL